MNFSSNNNTFIIIPTAADYGTYLVSIILTDTITPDVLFYFNIFVETSQYLVDSFIEPVKN